jgi:hypothetical protein
LVRVAWPCGWLSWFGWFGWLGWLSWLGWLGGLAWLTWLGVWMGKEKASGDGLKVGDSMAEGFYR